MVKKSTRNGHQSQPLYTENITCKMGTELCLGCITVKKMCKFVFMQKKGQQLVWTIDLFPLGQIDICNSCCCCYELNDTDDLLADKYWTRAPHHQIPHAQFP